MTLWKVDKFYDTNDNIYYEVVPYGFKGHLECCWKWFGLRGLKWCYLSKKQAKNKANKLNRCIQNQSFKR